MTLGGHVAADADKSQAESIAKSIATGQVVANQIAVLPPGGESEAKAVNSDLDKGIESNLDAALIKNRLNKGVKYDVKNGVVTLTGEVLSSSIVGLSGVGFYLRLGSQPQFGSPISSLLQIGNKFLCKKELGTSQQQ